ncbi:MAG: hypothetical protein IPO87_19195 [Flavobacteriales bacterium]|nr:hypothetical protein [Flavobacteriales bacterium]
MNSSSLGHQTRIAPADLCRDSGGQNEFIFPLRHRTPPLPVGASAYDNVRLRKGIAQFLFTIPRSFAVPHSPSNAWKGAEMGMIGQTRISWMNVEFTYEV